MVRLRNTDIRNTLQIRNTDQNRAAGGTELWQQVVIQYRPIQLTHDNGLVLRLLLLCDPLVLSILQPVHLGHVLPHHLEQVKNVYFPLDQYNFDAKNWFKYSKFNPPGPETFFASDFNFFLYVAPVTLQREDQQKSNFFGPEVHFSGVAKNVYLGVTADGSTTCLFV